MLKTINFPFEYQSDYQTIVQKFALKIDWHWLYAFMLYRVHWNYVEFLETHKFIYLKPNSEKKRYFLERPKFPKKW